jgi:hypothetical protein
MQRSLHSGGLVLGRAPGHLARASPFGGKSRVDQSLLGPGRWTRVRGKADVADSGNDRQRRESGQRRRLLIGRAGSERRGCFINACARDWAGR